MDYNLKGGVLIIGSLFWQDDCDNKDGIRKRWRENRLQMNKSRKVSVPIRYGRFSRDRTYTMVFDRGLSTAKYGKAKAVPFRNGIVNWDQLRTEVEALSEAEGSGNGFIKGDTAWCICCIVFNKNVSPEKRSDILDRWSRALNEKRSACDYFLQNVGSYGCTTQAELDIPWPTEAEEMDFLIATSLQPKVREGIASLTIQEIATHILNREYFIPNFLQGIGTHQDREILTAINSDERLIQLLFKRVVEHYEWKKNEDRNHRYWSWDHCYKAFHSDFDKDTKAIHLANYLASWGMNRGSGGLLQKDYRIHLKTVEILSSPQYSAIDCCGINDFPEAKVNLVFQIQRELSKHYSSINFERMGDQLSISPTDTLISKILLGTLGCTPAHDEFLKLGLKVSALKDRSFSRKGFNSLLNWITQFEIQSLCNELPGSARKLPLMKLIDIYFWTLGYQLAIIEK